MLIIILILCFIYFSFRVWINDNKKLTDKIYKKLFKMGLINEFKCDIATSILIAPCDIDELMNRDFLKNKSDNGIIKILNMLEQDGALYYKGKIMHIKKYWAKKNLKNRENE